MHTQSDIRTTTGRWGLLLSTIWALLALGHAELFGQCAQPTLYPATYNCDGSVTVRWSPSADAISYTLDLEDMSNPAVDAVNITDTMVTIAPGSLLPGTDYPFALTANCGNSLVSSVRDTVMGSLIQDLPPVLTVSNIMGTSCPDSFDGQFDVTVTDAGCGASYIVAVDGQAQTVAGGATATFSSLGVGAYNISLALSTAGACQYRSDCVEAVAASAEIVSTDATPPTIDVFTNLAVAPPAMQSITPPEGECGYQFVWLVFTDDNCAPPALEVNVATFSENASVFPGGNANLTFTGSNYVLEGHAAVGTNVIDLIATDADGNRTDITYTIEVVDNRPPVIQGPVDMLVETPSCDNDVPVNWTVFAIDNCDADPQLTQTQGPASGSYLTPGTYTVAYEAADDYGNTATYEFDLTVAQGDSPAPVVDISGNTSFNIPSCDSEAFALFAGTIIDCNISPTANVAQDISISGAPLSVGYVNVQSGFAYFECSGVLTPEVYGLTIDYKGVTVQNALIEVTQEADQAPVVQLPGNLTYTLPVCQSELHVNANILVSDDCDQPVDPDRLTVAFNGQEIQPNGTGSGAGFFSYTLLLTPALVGNAELSATYTDAAGQATTVSADLAINAVRDEEAPAISFPNLDIVRHLNACADPVQEICFQAYAQDNCDGSVPVLLQVQHENGSLYPVTNTVGNTYCTTLPVGSFDVLARASDNQGNLSVGEFGIQITQDTMTTVNLACNDQINVVLDGNCNRAITPDMLLEGTFGCLTAADFLITINDELPENGRLVDGHGLFEYHIALVPGTNAGPGFLPCWGNIRATDNRAPEVEAPANTSTGLVGGSGAVMTGLFGAESAAFNPSLHACLSADFPGNAVRPYEVYPFEVTADGYYTFLLEPGLATGGVGMALVQGETLNMNLLCASVMAQAGPADTTVLASGARATQLTLPLESGKAYHLLVIGEQAGASGHFSSHVLSHGGGQISTASNGAEAQAWAPEAVAFEVPLFCTDLDALIDNPESLDLTGAPLIIDNCEEVSIAFEDQVAEGNDCSNTTITRTFEITDMAGNQATAVQAITLSPSDDLGLVNRPPNNIEISCDEVVETLPNGYPTPLVTGYPFINTVSGIVTLQHAQCNLAATYQDGPRIDVCSGTYKFTRTWQVFDWCTPGAQVAFQQWVKVGDFSPPAISAPEIDYNNDGQADTPVFSASPFSCAATFSAPLPVVGETCSDFTVFTEVMVAQSDSLFDLNGQFTGINTDTVVVKTIPANASSRIVSSLPLGHYFFRYRVDDDCGNSATALFPFEVVDDVAPVAVCDQGLVVSIGGNNFGRLFAADVDNGSSDNCGIENIAIRRDNFNSETGECGSQWSNFGPYVDFHCCDVGEPVMVEIRVVDEAGHANTCMVQIVAEEKIKPTCVAPENKAIDCTSLPLGFDPENQAQLQALFGLPSAQDNCGATASELQPTANIACDTGFIIRRFEAVDNYGNISENTCQQTVTINAVHNYEIRFPADSEAVCGVAQADTVTTNNIGCDVLAVSFEDEIFEPANGECYRIYRTWRVINWCQYDGISEPFLVSRDTDCDTQMGEEPVYVLHRPDGFTYIDRDTDETEGNNNPLASENLCQGFDDYWQRADYNGGFYQYTQVIAVNDEGAPTITAQPASPFCSLDNESCEGQVNVAFSVSDDCIAAGSSVVEVRVFYDAFDDGLIDTELTMTGAIAGTYPDFTITGAFPVGAHRFEVRASDGCGNTAVENIPFEVEDCVVPSVPCLNGLVVELSPFDSNGDGVPDAGMGQIFAQTFVVGMVDDCSGPVSFSINRLGEQPSPNHASLLFNCQDTGLVEVEIHAYDLAGNSNNCETFLFVQDNLGLCDDGFGAPTAAAAGAITTEAGAHVEEVEVNLSGQNGGWLVTGADGSFAFEGLVPGQDYTLTPQRDGDDLNGVSTFDLLLIHKHILGVQPFSTPYQRIAADVNNSGGITTLDLITLRKLILGNDLELSNNSSWRFVEADYVFPNPADPWQEVFPEVYNINDIPASGIGGANFVAIKIGDVSGDVQANNLLGLEQRSTAGLFTLEVQDQLLERGAVYTLPVYATDLATVSGFQGTLSFVRAKAELLDIQPGRLSLDHLGTAFLGQGMLTMSWNEENTSWAASSEEGVLFELTFRAREDIWTSELLRVSSRVTLAEAYAKAGGLLDLDLRFSGQTAPQSAGRFELHQNQPNPFRDETQINFELPEPGPVQLIISDVAGRVVKVLEQDGQQGMNTLTLSYMGLPAGVLQYSLRSGSHFATRRMMILAD